MKTVNYSSLILLLSMSFHIALAKDMPFAVVVGQDAYHPSEPGQVNMSGFLNSRMMVNREGRLQKHIQEDALLAGFRHRPGSQDWVGEHVGKWLHASALAWEYDPNDTELYEKIENVANGLMDCQLEDGYLGTYEDKDRWTRWDVWVHKYDLIGLLSYYRITGDTRAMTACRKIGDLMIGTFGDGKRDLLQSGTHAGMAATSILEPMCLLYQYTGDEKYLQFCQYIVRRADAGPKLLTNIENTHSVQNVGNKKAYEMMSNYVGLVEYWRATGDERALQDCKLAWQSIVDENLFITGAVDAHEHFSEPHTLITTGKCTETCVQVTWVQMNWELLRATGNPQYAAMLHHHIYNHMLAAQNSDGIDWCYFTTMEGKKEYGPAMHCCGSSGPRAIALIPTFAYMSGPNQLAINLYENSTYKGTIDGVNFTVQQETQYPLNGNIHISLTTEKPIEFALKLLVPDFVKQGKIVCAGIDHSNSMKAGQYVTLQKKWEGKTDIQISFDMPLEVHQRDGRIAISGGPLVLACETFKENVEPDISKLKNPIWPDQENNIPKAAASPDLGHISISLPAKWVSKDKSDGSDHAPLTYTPYCVAGDNGEPMSIWMPLRENEK